MAHRHRKRGRPKKPGPRTESGRLSEAYATIARQRPTPEVEAKRRLLVGDNADPDMSATALGILKERGYLATSDSDPEIELDRYNAGMRYAILAGAVYGPRWPGNGAGREITEEQCLNLKIDLERIERRLTYDQRQILDQVVRSNWLPTWYHWARMGKLLTLEDNAERDALIASLDAIRTRKTGITAPAA